jgi:hypothetical protein
MSVFEVTIGDGGKPGPHIHFEVEVNIGGTSASEGRAELNTVLGKDPETLVPYVVLQGASTTHASELATGLNTALETAKAAPAEDPMQNPLGFLLSKAKNDDGDVVTPTIANHGENTILTLDLQAGLKETASNVLLMASTQAGAILENKNHICFSLDIGTTFESIMNSNNLVLDLFNSLDVKLELGIGKGMGPIVNQVISGLPLPDEAKRAIAMATLFRSAVARAKFASPDALPESVKGMIPPTDMMMEQKGMVMMMIPESEKNLLQLIGSHGTGKVTIYLLTPHTFLKVIISLPGLSKFLF